MNIHYFLRPLLDKWPDKLGENVGTLLWSFCNYQQKAVTFPPCWWNPLLRQTGQKSAALLLLCSIRSWHRLMSNISPGWMMRLGKKAAATGILCIGLQGMLCSVCSQGRPPALPAGGCVLPHSVCLWAMQCWGTAPNLPVVPQQHQGDREASQPSLVLLSQPCWDIPGVRGKDMPVTGMWWSTGTVCLSSFTGVICQARIQYPAWTGIRAPGLFLQILLGRVFSSRRTLHHITFISVWKGRM